MCSPWRTLNPSASRDSRAICRSMLLNVALAGLTSATVSPAASRFGLTTAGAAARSRLAGSWGASVAAQREWTNCRRFMPRILPRAAAHPDPHFARDRGHQRCALFLFLDAANQDDQHVGPRAIDEGRVVVDPRDRA